MYEDFFGLIQRPYSTIPYADDFVGIAPFQDALDALVHCVTQSRGIAVITADHGLGKTMLCKRLAKLLQVNHRSIFLNAAGLETRLGLLQGILFELNVGYVGLTDQEARLKLLDVARQSKADQRSLLLIVDEAQRLTPRLFEELRALTEYAPDGQTLIQAILCGPFELEEQLTDPALSAFSRRIGFQLALSPLSMTDSARLVTERLKISGASNPFSILSEEALELICQASDGNPRCLTQLTDHACLLAFAEECRPVSTRFVRAALADLKELPLRWNEIPDDAAPELSSLAALSEQSEDDYSASLLQDGVPVGLSESEMSEIESALTERVGTSKQPHAAGPISSGELETDEFLIPEFLHRKELPIESESASEDCESAEPVSDDHLQIDQHLERANVSAESASESEQEFAVFEVGAGMDENSQEKAMTAEPAQQVPSHPLIAEPVRKEHIVEAASSSEPEPSDIYEFPISERQWSAGPRGTEKCRAIEIPVIDRYTLLDRLFELPEDRRGEIDLSRLDHSATLPMSGPSEAKPMTPAETAIPEAEMLELVQQIRNDISRQSPVSAPRLRTDETPSMPQPAPARKTTSITADSEMPGERRFEQLFTRLRSRRRKAAADQQQ